MAFDVGESVRLEATYRDDDILANPASPVKVYVRRAGDEQEGPFDAQQESEGVYTYVYEGTEAPGKYYYKFVSGDGGVQQDSFTVSNDDTSD
jgi:hypothetical protein